MKKEIYISIFGIIIAEIMVILGNILYGLGIYAIDMLVMTLMIIFRPLDIKVKNILQSIILLTIFRMISFSMPLFFDNIILQYLLIYGITFIPVYYIIKSRHVYNGSESSESSSDTDIIIILIGIATMMTIIGYATSGPISIENIYIGGIITTISLIISLMIALLISDTKYLNKYVSDTVDLISCPLLVTFFAMTIFKMM